MAKYPTCFQHLSVSRPRCRSDLSQIPPEVSEVLKYAAHTDLRTMRMRLFALKCSRWWGKHLGDTQHLRKGVQSRSPSACQQLSGSSLLRSQAVAMAFKPFCLGAMWRAEHIFNRRAPCTTTVNFPNQAVILLFIFHPVYVCCASATCFLPYNLCFEFYVALLTLRGIDICAISSGV